MPAMGDKRGPDSDGAITHPSKHLKADVLLMLNDNYLEENIQTRLAECWKNKQDCQDVSGASLFQEPFCHCSLPNFIQDGTRLGVLEDELNDLELAEKNNDLYKFHQSKEDLQSAGSPLIKGFREMMASTVRDWLTKVTQIPLNDNISMFCAKYRYTDTLLCHDDELEGRRIAYIYYLVDDWAEEDGGALDLYSVDGNIQPVEIVKSVLPARNNFMFFEVSPGSYHQVAEVLSKTKTRLSVSGWFHGPPISRPDHYVDPAIPRHPCGTVDEEIFYGWVNPVYLSPEAQIDIQDQFEEKSEIELQDFLKKEKYDELLSALVSDTMTWTKIGPPNKRCYHQATTESLPPVVTTCLDVLRSDAMFLLLSQLTGLRLHELAEVDSDEAENGNGETGTDANKPSASGSGAKSAVRGPCEAKCHAEVRRWTRGSYTLVHDTDTGGDDSETRDNDFSLDLVLYVGCQGWQIENGGCTSYICKDEDTELLTVMPAENSLALVYRDAGTSKFVKHLNCRTKSTMVNKGFYDISATYYDT